MLSPNFSIYEIIHNPLIPSRLHIQHTLLEIVYIMDWWCLVDLLLHHALHFITNRIQI